MGVVTAEIGSTLSLTCQASGCPLPQLSWGAPSTEGVLRGNYTEGPRSELSLKVNDPAQEGVYTCHARCGSITASRQTRVNLFCEYLIQGSSENYIWTPQGSGSSENEHIMAMFRLSVKI